MPGCFSLKPPYQFTVPPHGSVDAVCKIVPYQPGPFELSQTVYVDDSGLRPIVLTVRAVGVAAGEEHR